MKNTTAFRFSARASVAALALGTALFYAQPGTTYPLDADTAGISRLQGHKPEVAAKGGVRQPPGALLSSADIQLHLQGTAGADWDIRDGNRSPQLQRALEAMFKERDPSYGVVVVDITDPEAIAWAAVRENFSQMPGSVGKILTMLGFLSELARAFPEPDERRRLLREHTVVAGEWVKWDEHKVPRYDAESNTIHKASIAPGDRFTLAEWIDHMVAASANSAAATVWKETVLLRHFGSDYPPSAEQEEQFFRDTPRNKLWQLASQAVSEPMLAAGLDPDRFWVGSFWTRSAKNLIPGNGNSRATPVAMARYLLRLEQGRLVDEWTSVEIKKYLYTTSRRYRYVYPGELRNAAVFFKSGSFYKCRPEPGFACAKYAGNVDNLMNSIAIVESPAQAGEQQKRYIVALMSNVLRKNSAWDHARIGAAVEAMIQTRAAATIVEEGSAEAIRGAGGQD
ncbi:hypothetical protein G8764_05665 [Pseudomaricurvus alcaniphilus]|uniref:serine hydrolase n=1 Tax=Pseudomaricurvus alcaniphilus TaxID=1166482 RepID=UPI0014096A40|nr:serine hydrolase [Pseudomaricurvus alcaniphilus]NHN36778.1 hypothetical protein [Pseudomaricurvus alcaniphilus]